MNLIAALMMAADLNGQALPEVVLLDFTAEYCVACKQMAPVLERMEHAGFPIRKIDITSNPQVSRQYRVNRIPTYVLLVEGREVRRFVGMTDERELRRTIIDAAEKLNMTRRRQQAEAQPEPEPPAESEQPPADTGEASAPEESAIGGFFNRIRNGLSGQKKGSGPSAPAEVRAQSPDEANVTVKDQAAMRATVRVRIDDSKFQEVGTGTIVYSTAGKSVILSCAHIFKEVSRDAAVVVEVFRDGQVLKYNATVLGGSHDSDLSFLEISNSAPLPVVPLAAQTDQARSAVFSIGCNGGSPPTVLNANIVEVDRFQGPQNIICSTGPVQGRSGGGLFNSSGELIGVCSGVLESKEGLYTGIAAVQQLMTKLDLNDLFQQNDDKKMFEQIAMSGRQEREPATEPPPSAADELDKLMGLTGGDIQENAPPFEPEPRRTVAASETAGSFGSGRSPATEPQRVVSNQPTESVPEITVIIDSRDPGRGKQVVVIPNPSPWLLELLTGEPAGDASRIAETPRVSRSDTHVLVTSARRPVQRSESGTPLPPARRRP